MKFIMTAFANLELALKLLAAAEVGNLTKDVVDTGMTWTGGGSFVVLPDESFRTNDDFILALQNNVTVAFGAAAITLNVCREEMGLPLPDPINSDFDHLVALIYQIRNCFAHDIAEPKWRLSPRYARVYGLGYKEVDLRHVNGKDFEYADIGGLETLTVLRQRLIGQ
jgi:hypothetical protein